jgi:hypothetical protein
MNVTVFNTTLTGWIPNNYSLPSKISIFIPRVPLEFENGFLQICLSVLILNIGFDFEPVS